MGQLPNLRSRRVLITGSGGMLGRAFVQALEESGQPEGQIRALARSELDVTDPTQVLSQVPWRPQIIVHCGANVNADACERDPLECRRVQVQGAELIARLANETGATVLYPQSFLIFDGAVEPIDEHTEPNPLSAYGRYKLEAEQLLRDRVSRVLVVRMGGFFGGDAADKNFVGRFVPHFCRMVAEGERHLEVGDRVWQPTYTLDLARNCLTLLNADADGVYNMASLGLASFAELARACVSELGLTDRFEVREVSAARFAAREAAKRPHRAVLSNARLVREGLEQQRPWRDALREYLSRAYFRELAARARSPS